MQRKENKDRQLVKLVREVIGGKPVVQVPVAQIDAVLGGMEEAKQRAIKSGQVERVQRIQRLMNELRNYEEQRRIKTPRRVTKESCEGVPDAVADSVLEDLVSGFPFDIAETPMIPTLIERCKHTITTLLSKGEYQAAQRYEDVRNQLVDLQVVRRAEDEKRGRIRTLEDQLAEATKNLEDWEAQFEMEMEENELGMEACINQMEQDWDAEMIEYDAVTNGELPPAARKFSAELLNLREKERFLLQSRRYEEAASLKEEADEMEELELSELHRLYAIRREKQKRKMRSDLDTKIACLRDNWGRKQGDIRQKWEKKIENQRRFKENLQNRLKALDAAIASEEASVSKAPSRGGNSRPTTATGGRRTGTIGRAGKESPSALGRGRRQSPSVPARARRDRPMTSAMPKKEIAAPVNEGPVFKFKTRTDESSPSGAGVKKANEKKESPIDKKWSSVSPDQRSPSSIDKKWSSVSPDQRRSPSLSEKRRSPQRFSPSFGKKDGSSSPQRFSSSSFESDDDFLSPGESSPVLSLKKKESPPPMPTKETNGERRAMKARNERAASVERRERPTSMERKEKQDFIRAKPDTGIQKKERPGTSSKTRRENPSTFVTQGDVVSKGIKTPSVQPGRREATKVPPRRKV